MIREGPRMLQLDAGRGLGQKLGGARMAVGECIFDPLCDEELLRDIA